MDTAQPQYTQAHIDARDLRIGRLVVTLEDVLAQNAQLRQLAQQANQRVAELEQQVVARDAKVAELSQLLDDIADDEDEEDEKDGCPGDLSGGHDDDCPYRRNIDAAFVPVDTARD